VKVGAEKQLYRYEGCSVGLVFPTDEDCIGVAITF
jgi:hypothetical protein